MRPMLPLPTPLLPYRGKKMFRFTVRVSQSGLDRELWERHLDLPVISPTPTAAIHLIQDEFAGKLFRPTEFECAGLRGGITHRYWGYEGVIGAAMFSTRANARQLELL
jgi:hypothetical protein